MPRLWRYKQKISGGFRTSVVAEYFARIRGFISTLRKQELSIIDSIEARKKKHDLINALNPEWNDLYQSIL